MELLTPAAGLLFWNVVAFFIVLIILRLFAWKPILKALKNREEKIESTIQSSKKLEIEMANIKIANEEAMKQSTDERQRIITEAKEIASNMINEARDKAKREVEHIMNDAQMMIKSEKEKMIATAKKEITSLVIAVSEKVLEKQLSQKKEQEQLILSLSKKIEIN